MKSRILSLLFILGVASCVRSQLTPDVLWQQTLNYSYIITDVTVSPDGKYTACPRNGAVDILQLANGTNVQTLTQPGGTWISNIRFSPDGKYVAATGSSELRVWNVVDWSLAYTQSVSGPIAFSHDSTMLATSAG